MGATELIRQRLGFAPRLELVAPRRLRARPTLSVLFSDASQSAQLRAQTYPRWQLGSDGVAPASFSVIVEPDAQLEPTAFHAVVSMLDQQPDLDVIYPDEMCAGLPYYKPDWSPDRLCGDPYIGGFIVVRTALLHEIGGLRDDVRPYLVHEALLRLGEHTTRIGHLPHILVRRHRLDHDPELLARLTQQALVRRGVTATTEAGQDPDTLRVRFAVERRCRVSIIVPTRDRLDLLRQCVDSLDRTLDDGRHDVELIVVDNGSQLAATREYLSDVLARRRATRVLRDDGNFNFSRLCNRGVEHASGDVLLFLNNDTIAEQTGWLDSLLEYAQQASIGAVGPKLLFPGAPRRVQSAGIVLGVDGLAAAAHRLRPELPGTWYGPNRVANYSAVTGACLMMRRNVFERLHGFDPQLAVAFNDVDACLRVWAAGYRVVYTPFAELRHQESASLRAAHLSMSVPAREVAYMRAKWGARLQCDPFHNPNLPAATGEFVSDLGRRFNIAEWVVDAEARALRHQPINLLRSAHWIVRVHGPRALARELVRFGLARP